MSGADERWTEEDLDLLRFLRADLGISHRAISHLLTRSVPGVKSQCEKHHIYALGGGPGITRPPRISPMVALRTRAAAEHALAIERARNQIKFRRAPPYKPRIEGVWD